MRTLAPILKTDGNMRRNFRLTLALFVFASLIMILGCGTETPAVNAKDQAQYKVLGILYGKFVSGTRGRAPSDQEQFLNYLSSKKPSWEKIVSSAEQLVVSPRDGKPLVVLYGEAYANQKSSVAPWVAYEQEGIDGTHLAVNIRGTIEEMDSAKLKARFGG